MAPERYPTRSQTDPSLAAMMIRSPQMAPVAPRSPASGHGPPVQYSVETKALDDMRRAQGAEHRSKQELKSKSRELSKLRQKEKDVISMSYHYQKRERELVAALEATEQRSSAELQEMRTVLASLQRQAESARSETQRAVDQVQRTQNGKSCASRKLD
uniref:Uncharacterized protein n=1 Tax=Mycena chlorophos TaxID=658473 RepID=A0ABQ0L5L0_MYCCL|nr:predicted protein [Mycena chlorophos]